MSLTQMMENCLNIFRGFALTGDQDQRGTESPFWRPPQKLNQLFLVPMKIPNHIS